MGRKKVRKYPTKKYYEGLFEQYFKEYSEEVIADMLGRLGFGTLDELRDAEMHMAFGLDCGWIVIYPRNEEMAREWRLDNGKYDYSIFAHPTYNPQSTTVKGVQVRKMLKDLGLTEEFGYYTRLD